MNAKRKDVFVVVCSWVWMGGALSVAGVAAIAFVHIAESNEISVDGGNYGAESFRFKHSITILYEECSAVMT